MNSIGLRLPLLSVLILASVDAHAGGPVVLITEPLTGEVVFGPGLGEVATGSFTYDPAAITGVGEESLTFPDLTLTLDFLGQTFTQVDDTDFDAFPELVLVDGTPAFLDYFVLNGDGVGQEILHPEIEFFSLFPLEPNSAGGFFADIITIPEPATFGLLASAAVALSASRQRRTAA